MSTVSPSTIVIFPTPARAINSAAKEPTPPKPTTKMFEFFRISKPSSLNNNSALSCQTAIEMYFIMIELRNRKLFSNFLLVEVVILRL